MKMFKKTLLLTLAVMSVLLLFTSCGKDSSIGVQKDSSEMYTDAKTKTERMSSYEVIKTVDRVFTGESGSFSDSSVTVFKQKMDPNGSMRYFLGMSSVLETELGDNVSTESSVYCIDNMMYENRSDGEKISYVAKDSDISERFEDLIPVFPAQALSKSSVYEGDVTQIVSNTNASTLYAVLYNYLGGLTDYYSPVEGKSVFEFTYSNVTIKFNIGKEGCFEMIEMSFDAHFDHKKGRSGIKTVVTFEFSNPDEVIDVNVPDDAGEYIWLISDEDVAEYTLETEIEALFDELGNPVAEYDAKYAELCDKYGKEKVDLVISKF